MLELIQGEGGVNILDPEYVKELVKYCTTTIFSLLSMRFRQA